MQAHQKKLLINIAEFEWPGPICQVNRGVRGQCSHGLQSCQQKLPAVTGKPNSILTSWHFRVEFILDGWSWVFRLQSTTVLCLKKLWAGIDSYRVIYLWTPNLMGMEAEFSISLDYSGNLEWIQHFLCTRHETLVRFSWFLKRNNLLYQSEEMRHISLRDSPSVWSLSSTPCSVQAPQSLHPPLHAEPKPTMCSTPCSSGSCALLLTPGLPLWIPHHEVLQSSPSYPFQTLMSNMLEGDFPPLLHSH